MLEIETSITIAMLCSFSTYWSAIIFIYLFFQESRPKGQVLFNVKTKKITHSPV